MLIKRFAESKECPPLQCWYELANGDRIKCDEFTIEKLWCNWVQSFNCNRADTNEFTVFEFIKLAEIDLATAENWIR